MGIKQRIIRLEQKSGGTGNFSLIPQQERVVAVSGYTREEREARMTERLADMHKKFGKFDESYLTLIHIRLFGTGKLTTCRQARTRTEISAQSNLL